MDHNNFNTLVPISVGLVAAVLSIGSYMYYTKQKQPSLLYPVVPTDKEGFVTAFSMDNVTGIKDFFNQFGFVVIKNVLTPQECNVTIEEIWKDIINLSPGIERNDPGTWKDSWPSGRVGILGYDIAAGPRAWENRQNHKLREAFALLMGTDDLLVSVDRYGIMRPTKDVYFPNEKGSDDQLGVRKDCPQWVGPQSWFHWDMNPWKAGTLSEEKLEDREWKDRHMAPSEFISENNEVTFESIKMQGLVVLADSNQKDGGFQCVAGFQHNLDTWAARNIDLKIRAEFVNVPLNDELISYGTRVTARAGSLIIWSSELPHCNFPNESKNFRYCQYIKMFPVKESKRAFTQQDLTERSKALLSRLPKGFTVSENGRKVFGFEDFPPQ